MPAGLTKSDTMFSVREKPWHGLGKVLKENPKSVAAALKASGLDWEVQQLPLTAGLDIEVPNYVANVRMDTKETVGVVGPGFTVVQNVEAFQFLEDVLGKNELLWETAGSMWGGKRVWAMVRLPEHMEVGGDTVDTYLYIAQGHDGSLAVTADTTPIRIVCQNTLRLALDRTDAKAPNSRFRFHHSGDLQAKLAEAQAALGVAETYAEWFKGWGDKLATQPFTDKQMTGVLKKWMPIDDSMGGKAITNREQARELVMAFFKGEGPAGDTSGNAPGTRWTAVNAVSEYADWGRGRREEGGQDQMDRSFEDLYLKKQGVKLVLAAR